MKTHVKLAKLILLSCLVVPFAVAEDEPAAEQPAGKKDEILPVESREQRDARMKWWREARFGMFIHWGVYSVPAGTYKDKQIGGIGEWIMFNGSIPVAEYAEYAKKFNPVKFNAEEWVRIAKDAGMKYIVITSKHHDGFAMYRSEASSYNIYDATPFKRDPLKELADACRKEGIRLGFYYSQAQDWHHSGGAAFKAHWDKAQDGDMTEYIKNIAAPQVKEILTKYGPGIPAVLWWDTPCNMTKERAEMLLPLLKLQPGIIWNNRLGGGYNGDTETPEQHIPATGYKDRDWETCMTLNDTWGYKSYDNNWKSTQTLIRNLVDIASKGGNYLLNVGPTSEGLIPEPSIERLKEVGKWMKANGEAVYATSASPFKRLSFEGRCTQKPGKLFFHVFTWPKDGKLTVPITSAITRAYLLVEPSKALAVESSDAGKVITLPADATDAVASVVVVEIEGKPEVVVPLVQPGADGSITLTAVDAEIVGDNAKLEDDNIGWWTSDKDIVQWANVNVAKKSTYEVELTYACAADSGGTTYKIVLGDQSLEGTIAATKDWKDYTTVKVGKLTLNKTGRTAVVVKPTKQPRIAVMNLRTLKLIPAAE